MYKAPCTYEEQQKAELDSCTVFGSTCVSRGAKMSITNVKYRVGSGKHLTRNAS